MFLSKSQNSHICSKCACVYELSVDCWLCSTTCPMENRKPTANEYIFYCRHRLLIQLRTCAHEQNWSNTLFTHTHTRTPCHTTEQIIFGSKQTQFLTHTHTQSHTHRHTMGIVLGYTVYYVVKYSLYSVRTQWSFLRAARTSTSPRKFSESWLRGIFKRAIVAFNRWMRRAAGHIQGKCATENLYLHSFDNIDDVRWSTSNIVCWSDCRYFHFHLEHMYMSSDSYCTISKHLKVLLEFHFSDQKICLRNEETTSFNDIQLFAWKPVDMRRLHSPLAHYIPCELVIDVE